MPTARKLGIIIAAGGSGPRFGKTNKLFQNICGLPVFIRSVRNFLSVCPGKNIVIPVADDFRDEFEYHLHKYLPDCGVSLTRGGATRPESVMNGIAALPRGLKWIAVHDAARPLANADLLCNCLEQAIKYGGAAPAKRVTDTIKQVNEDNIAVATVDRTVLRSIETPQVFKLEDLKEAYESLGEAALEYTDDAGVFTACGGKVYLLENPAPNIKVTFPEDMTLLEQLSK